MNSKLYHRIQTKLNDLIEKSDTIIDRTKFQEIEWLFEFVEANVTAYGNLWEKIRSNIQQKFFNSKSLQAKNSRLSWANLFEIRYYRTKQYRMNKINNRLMEDYDLDLKLQLEDDNDDNDEDNNGKDNGNRRSYTITDKILDLVNESIRSCHFDDNKLMARLFFVRSKQLAICGVDDSSDSSDDSNEIKSFEKESIRQALINIDYALRFYLSKQYLLTKIYLLMKLGNEKRSEKLLKILIENYEIKSDDEFRKFLQTKYDNRSPICKPEYLSRMFIDSNDSNDSNDDHMDQNSRKEKNHQPKQQQTSYLDQRLLLINRSGQGRFFIANESIDKDELILRERPYTIAMFTESSLKRCQNCYRQVTNIFFPCINCNEIIYCSINCLEQSYDCYHRFECRMNQYWIDCSKSTYHMFKLLNRLGIDNVLKLTSFDQQEEQQQKDQQQQQQAEQQQQQQGERQPEQRQESSSISIIEDYINDQKSTENDVKSKQNDVNDEQQMNLFQIFSKLVDNNDKHGLEFLSYHFTNALNITISAMIVQGYTEKPLSRRKMLHLLNVCFIGIRRISMNSFQWSNVGTCVCLIASLFNHRCDNNAEWKFIDGYYYLNVCRPIAAYEEISINYGCGWPLSTFEQRLRQHSCYFFQCNCIQCMEDSKLTPALQCKHCTIGPVLLSRIVYNPKDQNDQIQDNQGPDNPDNDAICLLCYQPYTNTRQTLNRLKFLRNQIHLITNMFGCLKENLHEKYLMILKSCMNELTDLMYRKNRILMDDLQKCCEIFVENSSSTILTDVDHQFLIKYGQIIDNILPEYDLELPKIDSLDD
uniref:Uncharacterized protein LOC113789125 n=1 Tax=Dermatophagoides pteronyssinus TaxID=6956 RepID=A0A6P6XLQ5_DERPT